nr:hypothetical protein [Chitinispirillaceae bacterium]
CLLTLAFATLLGAASLPSRQTAVTGGPAGPHPYLFKSVSSKQLVETGRSHQWAITFGRGNSIDSIRIIALRVEFNKGVRDSSALTTGSGLFGIRTGGDQDESNYYASDTVYKYDALPHDSLYFQRQIEALGSYYAKVSRGKLRLKSTIYPAGSGQTGYAVPQPMTYYSPGGKKKLESWDEYYNRKTKGLLLFVKDALLAAAADWTRDSIAWPFRRLRFEKSDSTLRDENNMKTVILILHAGSSYLTDGGTDGSGGRDTPSDMIDAFINRPWFKAYKDSLGLPFIGVTVRGAGATTLTLDEVMMCSETSNQDGLNWGIQGILVNQMARQLGIPDLFSTSSGVSAIGAFCIMDFAGYSAGNGFIPPYPSAWVRAFMGWDNVKTASIGTASSFNVKALTSVLDRDSFATNSTDTTILLVPLNDHEYYLVENRQRNIFRNDSLFNWDTTDHGVRVIAPYPYNVRIDSNVTLTSGKSNVIMKVRNNDVSLPASGVLVWHVDEQVIRDRLAHNLVNADSIYRGVALVEADGVFDLGITFQDVFYQAAFDYGGAEDVFPHRTSKQDSTPVMISGFGPFTAPSSRSNDGGNSYLRLAIDPVSRAPGMERSWIRDYVVDNFVDSVFTVSTGWDYLVRNWPKFASPDNFYEPVLADLDKTRAGKELVLLGKSGRLFAWSTDSAGIGYGTLTTAIDRIDLLGDTVSGADTVTCVDSIRGALAMPSVVNDMVFIPTTRGITVLKQLGSVIYRDSIDTRGRQPSSYVCQYRDSLWAVGCAGGLVVTGRNLAATDTIRLGSDSPVTAIAAIRENGSSFAAIQSDGRLSLCRAGKPAASARVPYGIGPYTLVTGDLDRDTASEIVVCDSRHGLWVYKQDMTLAPGWDSIPTDWPSVYVDTSKRATTPADRNRLPVNTSAPALADLNRDGYLDILVSGTNGLYAFNYKNVLIGGWPSYLDNRYWYQRGGVLASPVVVTGEMREPLVLFSSPTGERPTFRIAKIEKADLTRGTIWFRNEQNALDSLWDLPRTLIDTLLTLNDSLVAPYTLPGGFVDAVKSNGKRPLFAKSLSSNWPLTTGAPVTTAPMAGVTATGSAPDLFAVSNGGWVYRWKLGRAIMPDSLFWPLVGYDAGRSFAYGGGALTSYAPAEKEPITFFSYPNPTYGLRVVMFKYKFSGAATKVRLDIFTFSGYKVFSSSTMGAAPAQLTGSYPDWNELRVPIDRLSPAVYRCRMEATIAGKKHVRFWKLAVTR